MIIAHKTRTMICESLIRAEAFPDEIQRLHRAQASIAPGLGRHINILPLGVQSVVGKALNRSPAVEKRDGVFFRRPGDDFVQRPVAFDVIGFGREDRDCAGADNFDDDFFEIFGEDSGILPHVPVRSHINEDERRFMDAQLAMNRGFAGLTCAWIGPGRRQR